MDPHTPVTREAIDGNAVRRKLAPTASLVLTISTGLRRDAMQPNASFQNLLHRAC